MKQNIVADKSIAFAIRMIKAYQFLCKEQHEYIISKQMVRSGTSIGANVCEAEHAESKADFVHKMSIALKEANETNYWLLLLNKSEYINSNEYDSIHKECDELIRLLATIVKTTKKSIQDAKAN